MKITKQIISIILLLTLLAGMVPTTVKAEEAQTTVENGGITIEGTNSFGTLLSEDIQEQQEAESDYSGGYGVINLVVEDGIATVEYDTLEEAFLVVSLYTEDGLQLLVSGNSLVQPEETVAIITLEGEIPEYFMASAFLLDTYDYSPLCASYDTPMYTKEMQELLASTTDDYDADKVLNLDDDKTTNFAVYADTTKVLEYSEGVNTVISADDETATYVIENADEYITGLQVGDVLAYPYGEDQILIVKVATIAVDGTTATITGDELEMEEVFSYAKIEKTGNESDVTVDGSALDEGVVFDGLTQEGIQTYGLRSTQGEGSIKNYLNYKLDKKIKSESDYTEASVTLKGSLGLELDIDISYYISMTRQFMKFETDVGLKLALSVSGKAEAAIPLGDLSVIFFGVSIGFEPEVQLQLQGKVEYSLMAGFTIGYIYDNYVGLLHLNTTPKVESDFKIEASIFIGIDMAPKIDILKGVIAEAKLKAPIGLELKAKLKGTLMGESATQGDRIHACEKCIEMELNFKVEFSAKLEFLKCKWLTLETKVKALEVKIGEYYWSLDNSEFGEGNCPYVKHRVTVQVKANNGQGVPDTDIIVIPEELKTEINLGKTNGSGVLTTYLQAGAYTLRAVVEGETLEKAITVKEAYKVTLDKGLIDSTPSFISGINPESLADYGYVVTSGECGDKGDNVTWTLYSSGLLKIEGTGAMNNWSSVSAPWRYRRNSIKGIIIANGITSIGTHAFYNCTSLTSITIPESVTSIGNCAFENCHNLADVFVSNPSKWCKISFGDSYANPNVNARLHVLDSNGNEVTDVVLDDSVTEIPDYAFHLYIGLASITIPESVTSIGDRAFSNCDSLTRITIPDNVYSIGNYAFSFCDSLTNVTALGSISSIDNGVFYSCSNLTSITVGNSVTTIGDSAFAECTSLTSIMIPDSVTAIGYSAFSNCTRLNSITIPDSVTTIGGSAFRYCDSLTGITIGKSVTNIGSEAFYSCGSLTGISIPDGVKSIETQTFRYCKSLTSIALPRYLERIGDQAFSGCSKLASITVPEKVTYIGYCAFEDCNKLSSVNITSLVAWCNINFYGDSNPLTYAGKLYLNGELVVNLIIPNDVTSIVDYAFSRCSSIQTVTIPDGITSIGNNAFYNCTSLTSVIIPDSVTSIGNNAFCNCSNLTSITIPNGVISIGSTAFYNCHSLQSITIPDSVTNIGDTAFGRCYNLDSVIIGNGVISIGKGMFKECGDLTSIMFSDNLIGIGEEAFYHCTNLTSIELPNSVNVLGDSAFIGCSSLQNIIIPKSAISIGSAAFAGCSSMNSITIPDKITSIGSSAFHNCKKLTDVYYGGTAEQWDQISIGSYNEDLINATIHYRNSYTTAMIQVALEENISHNLWIVDETDCTEGTDMPTLASIFDGEYGTEITDEYTLKTASFTGLVPGAQYVLLVLVSIEVEDVLASDNLLYIEQDIAAEDGTLTFTYVQREATDVSYVMACGASHNDIKDAVVTFPEMTAGAENQTVDPTVIYNGNTLVEGVDYVVVGTVDYTAAGVYTCYIRGIYNYTGIVACTYTVDLEKPEVTFSEKVYHNLRLQDLTKIGYAFTITTEEVVDVYGVLIWTGNADAEITVDTEGVQNKALAYDSGFYTTESDGIYAQRLDTVHYAKPYVKIGDQYIYGSVDTYSPLTYAQTVLNGNNAKLKQLMIDLLNYGTYAQLYFAESNKEAAPEVLVNDILTEEQKVMNWSDDLKVATPTVTKDTAKTLETKWYGTNLNLLEAIQMNMAATGNIAGMYYWTEDAYNNAEVLNSESASGEAKIRIDGSYTIGGLTGIVAQSVSDVYYVCGYDESGNLGAIRADSVAAYATRLMESAASTEATVNMAKALLIYGDSAEVYFTQND